MKSKVLIYFITYLKLKKAFFENLAQVPLPEI